MALRYSWKMIFTRTP